MNKESYLQRAQGWLKDLRKGTSAPNAYTHYLREALREGGLSLADIGTNEEELASFAGKAASTQ